MRGKVGAPWEVKSGAEPQQTRRLRLVTPSVAAAPAPTREPQRRTSFGRVTGAAGALRAARRCALRGVALLLLLFGAASVAGVVVATLVTLAEQLTELGHASASPHPDP